MVRAQKLKTVLFLALSLIILLSFISPLPADPPSYQVQWISHNTPTQMSPGQTVANISVTIKNLSNFAWTGNGANPVRLSYHWLNQAGQTVVWEGVRSDLPGDVAPGQEVTLSGAVVAPSQPGYYTLYWDLVHEGITWFSAQGSGSLALTVNVDWPTPQVVIDLSDRRLYLFQGNTLSKAYAIAIGKPRTPTPVNEWLIGNKYYTSPRSVYGSRKMRLYKRRNSSYVYTRYNIHGTNAPSLIGGAVSKGCIRMFNRDVEELFNLVPLRTKVLTRP